MDSASAAGSINPAGQSSDCRTDVRSEQQNQSRRLLSADTHSSLPFIPAGLTNKPPVSAGHHVDTHTQTHAHTHTNTRAWMSMIRDEAAGGVCVCVCVCVCSTFARTRQCDGQCGEDNSERIAQWERLPVSWCWCWRLLSAGCLHSLCIWVCVPPDNPVYVSWIYKLSEGQDCECVCVCERVSECAF